MKHSNLQEKNVFRNSYFGSQSFLYFAEFFVIAVIAVICQ